MGLITKVISRVRNFMPKKGENMRIYIPKKWVKYAEKYAEILTIYFIEKGKYLQ